MTALDVTGLRVDFGGIVAVDGVSLTIEGNTVAGLIGPNGAGKTTTIDALCGFVPAAIGSVRLDGRPIDSLPPHRRARAGLVRTFQSIELFDDLSVHDNLLVAAMTPRWWSTLIDAVAPRRQSRDVDVDFALDLVGLRTFRDALPRDLTHGQRRLVALARALAARPKVLLLDEPAAGLDPIETTSLATVVRSLPTHDISVLLIDHDMTLVLDACDTLTVLDLGRVIATGPTSTVRTDPSVVAAYLGASQ